MSPVVAITALVARTNSELAAVHDFFQHSQTVWQSFEDLVAAGHRITSENPATGSTIDQDGLVRLALRYRRAYLAVYPFQQFVATFEAFLFDLLRLLLLHNPRQLAKKTLDFAAVLRAADRDEIIAAVID